VEDADALALLRQGGCKACRDRRLADAALARADGENARGRGEGEALASLHTAAKLGGQRLPLLGGHHVEAERHLVDAVERRNLAPHLVLEARAEGTARDRQRDRDVDAPVLDLDRAHHVELRDGSPELRVDDTAQGLENGFATGHISSESTEAGSVQT